MKLEQQHNNYINTLTYSPPPNANLKFAHHASGIACCLQRQPETWSKGQTLLITPSSSKLSVHAQT
jgi:hypothetical protein